MKLKYTILLVFFYAYNVLAVNSSYTNKASLHTNSITTVESNGEAILNPPRIAADDGGAFGGLSVEEDETLDSVLGYFIFIFLSVLVIILIDNRNLEKRYKKLLADFKSKD